MSLSAFISRRAAHQRDDFIRRHFKIAAAAQAFHKPLAASSAAAACRRLNQPDDARLDLEFNIGSRHETGAVTDVLRDRDLPFRRDPHNHPFLTEPSKNIVAGP